VTQGGRGPSRSRDDVALVAAEETIDQSRKAFRTVVERTAPWLVEIGSWVFTGLIAFILVAIVPLITIASVDRATMIATVALALALPLDLAGLVQDMRLVQDMGRVRFDEEWFRALKEAGLPVETSPSTSPIGGATAAQRTRIVLLYSLVILVMSVLLILTGVTAAPWHVAWWIAVAFLAMAAISVGIVVTAFTTLGPPETPEQKERYRRYWEAMVRQAEERAGSDNQ